MSSLALTNKKAGIVFNIQHYSVHDGPGIRTIAFLKGCPLQCHWCSNPESQQRYPELAYNRNKCIGADACFRCQAACLHGAITEGQERKSSIDRERCQRCFQCVRSCPSQAMHIFGNTMTVNEVLKVVEADSMFYSRSGGGLTISGGEPLMQAEFTLELIKEAKRRRINTTIETCGYGDWADLKAIAEHLKVILFDIKSMNPIKHQEFTRVSNDVILSNFISLRDTFPNLDIMVRTPVIPGFNDSTEEIGAIMDFLKGHPNVNYELLPYHRMGQQKYIYLGRKYPMGEARLDDEKVKILKKYVSERT